MNAIDQSHQELLKKYRMALGIWSESRALYSPDAPEVAAANKR